MDLMRHYKGKHLVAYLRNNNYAHPGEEEAITLVMKKFKKTPQKILDVGCGLGGTSQFIHANGWGEVIGFDIESNSIDYAKNTYKEIKFYTSDVTSIHELFQNTFDISCIFTSFYAFRDQKTALLSLNKATKSGGNLVIFDYLDLCLDKPNPLFRASHDQAPFIPIKKSTIEIMLAETGWNIEQMIDISGKFFEWYEQLFTKLTTQKEIVIEKFGESSYQRALEAYYNILTAIKNKSLGGTIVYAKTK